MDLAGIDLNLAQTASAIIAKAHSATTCQGLMGRSPFGDHPSDERSVIEVGRLPVPIGRQIDITLRYPAVMRTG